MGTAHLTVEESRGGTVADVMLARPKTLPADSTVAAVRRLFEQKPSVRTALLVDGAAFRAAIDRADLPADAPGDAPALGYAREGDTIAPDAPVADALARLAELDEPRLVVVDADGVTLRGLVCLGGGGAEFCVDRT
jgi:CBS domain-containing protein